MLSNTILAYALGGATSYAPSKTSVEYLFFTGSEDAANLTYTPHVEHGWVFRIFFTTVPGVRA